ncbi:MAG: GNAT family N-acetyltransferase [Tenericutes bacterium]|nr:GNAT family N-acetyltransferase [Mycoplasmatota bacterium]
MIYLIDEEKKYEEAIKTLLRSYNSNFATYDDRDCIYLYKIEQNRLVGALTVHYSWDWATIGHVFYENTQILQQMIQKAWNYYQNKAFGIKSFTKVKEQFNDFLTAGFKQVNAIYYPNGDTYYYADLTSIKVDNNENTVTLTNEAIEKYQKIIDQKVKQFNQTYQINDEIIKRFDIAALEDQQCIGGIQCELYENLLYVDRLVVDKTYRKNHVGTELMNRAIEFAKLNKCQVIELGTTSFQAKPFYEKFGFKVVHMRENNPKGYQSFTMMKKMNGEQDDSST